MHFYPNSNGEPLTEFNSCHEPSGGSKKPGTFASKGSSGCQPSSAPEVSYLTKVDDSSGTQSSLLSGEVVGSEPVEEGGVNVSMFVEIAGPNGELNKAVYKPEIGEVWEGSFANHDIEEFITNKEFSLAEREAFAYEVDHALGTDVVPETVLRTEVDVEVDMESGGDGEYYDSDEARQQYEDWKEKNIDNMYEGVSEVMQEKYNEAQSEHVQNIENRASEVADIWNELVEEYPEGPDGPDYGTGVNDAPVLPGLEMDGIGRFDPKHRGGKELDPMDVLKDAEVDVDSKMSREERDGVRAILAKAMLEDGYDTLGDVDKIAARDDFQEWDDWIQEHDNTERQVMDDNVPSFSKWKADNNISDTPGRTRNDDAPHPNGGSLQRMVESPGWGSPTMEQLFRVAALDYAIGSMDRHQGNLMTSGSGKAHAIDNGYSMPSGNAKFRSVAVRGILSKPMPEALRLAVSQRIAATNWEQFLDKHPAINEDERSAFTNRIEALSEALDEGEDGLSDLWKNTRMLGQ